MSSLPKKVGETERERLHLSVTCQIEQEDFHNSECLCRSATLHLPWLDLAREKLFRCWTVLGCSCSFVRQCCDVKGILGVCVCLVEKTCLKFAKIAQHDCCSNPSVCPSPSLNTYSQPPKNVVSQARIQNYAVTRRTRCDSCEVVSGCGCIAFFRIGVCVKTGIRHGV